MLRDESVLGRSVIALAKAFAICGGLALMAIVGLVVVSVIGRALIFAGLRPITGDYELVSIGMGFAVFAFMPWVHLERGHALVSLVTDSFGVRANAWLLVASDLLMLMLAGFLAWRLYFGMIDKFSYHETTLLLRFPLGWAYALGLVGAVVMVVVALYVFGRSFSYALAGQTEPKRMGAEA